MTVSEATAPAEPPDDQWMHWMRGLLSYDVLHVRQRIRPFVQKYQVTDERGMPLFHVVRPPRLAVAMAVSLSITAVHILILVGVFRYMFGGGSIPLGLVVLFCSNFALGIAGALLAPYRDIDVFADESESWRILTITQDNKLGFWREYSLWDCMGNQVARFRRSTVHAIVRRHWRVETPDGQPLFEVQEDSLVRSLLRRYLGPLYGALRTNFDFELPDGTTFGHYNRKFTITDQYVLDLRADPHRTVDRRTTLAMAILLDTAESR